MGQRRQEVHVVGPARALCGARRAAQCMEEVRCAVWSMVGDFVVLVDCPQTSVMHGKRACVIVLCTVRDVTFCVLPRVGETSCQRDDVVLCPEACDQLKLDNTTPLSNRNEAAC